MIKSIIGGQWGYTPLPGLEELAMKKLPASKITILMVVLVLMGSSVACRITEILQVGYEAARETCIQVSRTRYERAAKELGETPRTPKDPENAVYEVCCIEDELYSVRMSEGYRDDEEQLADVEAGVGANPASAAGTYVGEELEVPPSWELVVQEFTIQIAEDGAVSGFKIYETRRASLSSTCNVYWGNGHTTLITGYIYGSEGLVSVETEAFVLSDFSDCDGLYNYETYESYCEVAQITVSGNQLEIRGGGSKGCGFVYKATKQE
jgi:hypothetical protein